MNGRRAVLLLGLLAAGLGVLHLVLAGTLELSPDEAYYWTWSKDLSLSYPDHPPLVAWLVAAGTALAGDTELGVRWPFVLLGTALVPLSFLIGRRSGLRPGLSLLVAAAVGTSLLGSAGALLATPETPFVFGWALALLGLAMWSSDERPAAGGALVAAGIALALASKLTGVLLPFVVAGWSLAVPGRSGRMRIAPQVAVVLGLALAAPLYVADLFGKGATVFQLGHGLWANLDPLERLANLGAYLGGQLGLLTPLIAVAVAVFLARPKRPAPAARALWLSSALPWFVFAFAALLAPPEPNWPACAHVGALVGAALAVEEARERGARWARPAWVAAALGLQLLASLVVHVHIVRPFLPLETAEPAPFTGPTDPAARLHGWRELVEALRRQGERALALEPALDAELLFYGEPSSPTTTTSSNAPRLPTCGDMRRQRGGPRMHGVWLIEPAPGAGLPGEERTRSYPGDVIPIDPRAVDPGLAHPAAPVRVTCVAWPGSPVR
jgi:4-amino-4-deoxy-L-arabinose transferase-like glycosyltransferase